MVSNFHIRYDEYYICIGSDIHTIPFATFCLKSEAIYSEHFYTEVLITLVQNCSEKQVNPFEKLI